MEDLEEKVSRTNYCPNASDGLREATNAITLPIPTTSLSLSGLLSGMAYTLILEECEPLVPSSSWVIAFVLDILLSKLCNGVPRRLEGVIGMQNIFFPAPVYKHISVSFSVNLFNYIYQNDSLSCQLDSWSETPTVPLVCCSMVPLCCIPCRSTIALQIRVSNTTESRCVRMRSIRELPRTMVTKANLLPTLGS